MAEKKFCPFVDIRNGGYGECMGKQCACWVELTKPSSAGNPFYHMEYEGCGLIQHIPWRAVKTEQKAK